MTIRELAESVQIPRAVALRLVGMIPGAKKEAAGPGQIPRWMIPDNALGQITEEMLEEARRQTASTRDESGTTRSDPALAEEERGVRRARLEADRLRAEADRLKAEEEVERLRDRRGVRPDPSAALVDRLENRLDRLERAHGDGARPDPVAPLVEMIRGVLTPLVEKAIAQPAPLPASSSLPEVLSLVHEARSLVGPPDEHFRELRTIYREGVEDGLARAGEGERGSVWAEVIRLLAPEVVAVARQTGVLPHLVQRLAGMPASAPPSAPPAPAPAPGPREPTPAARATVTVEGGAPVVPGQDPRTQVALGHVLGLLRQAIEMGSKEPGLYAELVDAHLPHFLDEWTALDQNQALAALATYDPLFSTEPAVAWLKAWWKFLKEEYLVEPPGGGDPGARS